MSTSMSMNKSTFDIILLNGRPAAGKSEVIDYLKKVPVGERIERFHIGEFIELDDFPILWEAFEDDDLYEKHGKPRLISNKTFTYNGEELNGYVFKDKFYWNFLIEKLNQQYKKLLRDDPYFHNTKTVIIEFARGTEHGGFQEAYNYLCDDILKRACTLYIDVPFEESLRKNRRRFNPDRPDSILQHALEDKKLEMLYKGSDWETISSKHPHYLYANDQKVPYAVFKNNPEITHDQAMIATHLQEVTKRLWEIRHT